MTRSSYVRSMLEPLRLVFSDRLAVTGLVVLGLIILMALLAPLVATHDPRHIVELEEASVLVRPVDELGETGGWRLEPPLGEVAVSGAATTGSELIAVGRMGTAHYFDGESWTDIDAPVQQDLHGVAISPNGRVLAVGARGTALTFDEGEWLLIETPRAVGLNDVTWLDDSHALLVGDDETLWALELTGDDAIFTELSSPVGRGLSLHGVATDIDGTALAVGARGIALRYDGELLALERLPSFRDLNGIHISPGGEALIVGERATVIRRDGGDWVEDSVPETRALRAGWIDDGGHALAVGRNGVIVEYDGETWTRAEILTERHFRAATMVGGVAYALGSDRFVNKLAAPSRDHLFGTDHLGRDLFSQNVYGSQIALLVGFIGAVLVVLIGANVGLVAGYYRGRAETFLMRAVDVMYGIPFEPFAMILVLLFGPSLTVVILAVALLTWRTVARLIRSQVLSLSERPFVKAARVAGASDLRIMYLHIFPNVLPLVFLELAIIVGVAIIAEATLSFLGLGPPQSFSWGGILHNARLSGAWRTAWWWNIPPGVFIMLTVMSVFFISRSLEVIANPRLRAR